MGDGCLRSKVGEWGVRRYAISPKCRIPSPEKFAIVRFPANVEFRLYTLSPDFTIQINQLPIHKN